MSEPVSESDFERVVAFVNTIPSGKVMAYGQVGREVGLSARTVGWAMTQIWEQAPWQRVVGADGRLPIAKRSPTLHQTQRELLEAEGVAFTESGAVDMARFQVGREPDDEPQTSLEI